VTRGVLWDSSAILALLDADDANHARAVFRALAKTVQDETLEILRKAVPHVGTARPARCASDDR